MKLEWDHVVHYVNDPEQAAEQCRSAGLTVIAGGSHEKWGTWNRLLYADLTYMEFIGIENEAVVRESEERNLISLDSLKHLPGDEAMSRIALRTDDLDKAAKALQEKGLAADIRYGEHRTADGTLLKWRMLPIEGETAGVPYPFLMEWGDDEAARRQMLSQLGALTHESGPIQAAGAVWETPDPDAVTAEWSRLFGFQQDGTDLFLNGCRFSFQKGRRAGMKEVQLTAATGLAGSKLKIGSGRYVFLVEEHN
ncbi:VOC family protein [Alkalicoccus luteus]|uniref:VOC family protein n=1 Tax=Alkalicoccus luteus TaxID=1237094 RepID=A0A969PPM5_9BACI|nr:VOC family protein [Alkalicoccus luteus]NJP38066.1 VOC family protein [Alkalicoccus luteus]